MQNFASIFYFAYSSGFFFFSLPLVSSFSGKLSALPPSGNPSRDALTTCQVLCCLAAPSVFFFVLSIRLSIDCYPFISRPRFLHSSNCYPLFFVLICKLKCEDLLLNASLAYLLLDFLTLPTMSLQVPNACRLVLRECFKFGAPCVGLQIRFFFQRL